MISSLIDLLLGSGLQLLLLLLGLFPTFDVESLPLAVPQSVTDVLAALNWFIPIGDLITIITVWIAAVLAVNVALIVIRFVNIVK